MNILKQKQETPGERSGPGDYYMVVAEYSTWYVSPEAAARIGRALDRRWRPRYVKFVDLAGSRAWLRADAIECISESTEHQRSGDRQFHYLLRKERRSDRRWDDDED